MTKDRKFSNIQSFNAIFVKFSTDFVDWNIEKSQQETSSLSSSLFRRDNCGFKVKSFQIGNETDKKPKIFKLSKFLCSFCQIYDRLRGLECLKGST